MLSYNDFIKVYNEFMEGEKESGAISEHITTVSPIAAYSTYIDRSKMVPTGTPNSLLEESLAETVIWGMARGETTSEIMREGTGISNLTLFENFGEDDMIDKMIDHLSDFDINDYSFLRGVRFFKDDQRTFTCNGKRCRFTIKWGSDEGHSPIFIDECKIDVYDNGTWTTIYDLHDDFAGNGGEIGGIVEDKNAIKWRGAAREKANKSGIKLEGTTLSYDYNQQEKTLKSKTTKSKYLGTVETNDGALIDTYERTNGTTFSKNRTNGQFAPMFGVSTNTRRRRKK